MGAGENRRRTDSGHSSRPSSGETVCRISAPMTGSAGALLPGHVQAQRRRVVARRQNQRGHVLRMQHAPGRRRLRTRRVAQNHRPMHSELLQGCVQQMGLFMRAPGPVCGARAVAEARPVEDPDAVALRGFIDQAAELEVIAHRAVAVQQHHRLRGIVRAVHPVPGTR